MIHFVNARWGVTAVVAALAVLALSGGHLVAQGAPNEAAALSIGVYDPQQAFEQSPQRQKLQQAIRPLTERFQQAQQEGDEAQMQAVHQQFQQEQERAARAFQESVDEALPAIAREAGVQVITLKVAYSAGNVEVRDLTREVVGAIANGAEAPEPQGILPIQP